MDIKQMRLLARELVRSLARRGQPGVGYTVIVHATKPTRRGWSMALETTLESTQQNRALLAEALTASVLQDGGDLDSVREVAARDYAEVIGKCTQ